MSVPAIGPVLSGVTPTAYLPATTALPGVQGATSAASGTSGASFSASLIDSVNALQAAQSEARTLGVRAVTGDLDDVHDYLIAASEAKVMLELTAAVRNKAVEAFTEIMRMQA